MSEASLKTRILNYIRANTDHDPEKWIHKGEIERCAMEAGYLADNAARRLRELHAESFILRRETEQGSVEYRFDSMAQRLKNVGLV